MSEKLHDDDVVSSRDIIGDNLLSYKFVIEETPDYSLIGFFQATTATLPVSV
jgi:hypothetical protein